MKDHFLDGTMKITSLKPFIGGDAFQTPKIQMIKSSAATVLKTGTQGGKNSCYLLWCGGIRYVSHCVEN
jgi:hypothetical protein